MRAISVFSFDAGTSSFWWRARMELRMRVTQSATGAVKLCLSPPLPVRSGFAAAEPAGMLYRPKPVPLETYLKKLEPSSAQVEDVWAKAHTPSRALIQSLYQLDLTTPGISPRSANWRKHKRQRPNLRR